MRYALLIYGNEAEAQKMSEQEMAAEMAGYNAFGANNQASIRGGEALNPTSSATTVRLREGKTLTTDGPFAETKEQLGGFYLVTCDNLDQAIAIAAQIPAATNGCIEVRPIMEFN
ncbi:MAG TPA: YciI family protein [Ktedonobacterales bacterium]|nr:YciI family protein [Ktedonobacterales bacterium]